MAIPRRAIQATCDIDAGTLDFGSLGPVFTGENDAADIVISLVKSGAAYSPTDVLAEMYLYWPGTPNMTEAVEMTVSGSTVTGTITDAMTVLPGCPLMVLQLTDDGSGELIVAAAAPVRITRVRGDLIVSSRVPSPSEIIYIGRSPYVGQNGHWYEWNVETRNYVDTGVKAAGDTAGFGTPSASVDSSTGTPSVTVSASGPDTAKVFNFEFHNLKGETGPAGTASDTTVASEAIEGADNVHDALITLDDQIGNLKSALKSGSQEDADYHLGFFINNDGYLCQIVEEE